MDRLTSMAVFVRAVEAGSFAAAAPALGLSSPMVGKHVRFLETRIGTQLLNRTTRRQSLTEVGRAYYERCKNMLAEAEAAEALAQDLQAAPRGRLRVTAPVIFGTYSLTPMLTCYMRRYPEVTVDLNLSDRVVDLIDEGFDAAIRISPLKDSTLMTRALKPVRPVACAAPAYLAERGTPGTPEELTDHECLGFAYSAKPPWDVWEFTDLRGAHHRAKVKSRFQANVGPALRAAALAGFGIILQAEDMVRDDLTAGRLVQVLPGFSAPSHPMHIVFPPSQRPTPKLRSFVDFVAATFG
jgi:DNA-binding transcriptional LysR family regulator